MGHDGQIMVDKEDEGGANELAQSGQTYAPGSKVLEEDDEENSVRQEPVPLSNGQQREQDRSRTQLGG